jgi:nucleotide-binding universal stress UspA family protein
MSRVLAAIDLGEGSSEALRQACAWAERSKGKLAIVHVMPDLVGTHTRHLALGSVAERVIRSAPCSVLVERGR